MAVYRRVSTDPPLSWPDYRSNALRAPSRPLVLIPQRLGEIAGPLLGADRVRPGDNDLTLAGPLGQRIIVTGRVLDGDGRPVPDSLVEIWQANASGRYRHAADRHPAPLDSDNSADPVLALVPAERRSTLVAEAVEGGYRFDIVLQGDGETVFFDV